MSRDARVSETADVGIPAVAIVDSRNVRGQIEDLFGQGRQIDVSGVIAMLADFGFDVSDVWVGVATTGDTRRGSSRLQQGLAQNQAFAERVRADPRGHVMEGRLVERGSGSSKNIEEKLVDVLCAMQIARTAHEIAEGRREGVIVVLSEDMDLIPAYEFARELGVQVYAASNERVDTRAQHSGWLLLPEESLELAAGRLMGNKKGTALRRSVVGLLTAGSSPEITVKVGYTNPSSGLIFARHNSGASAILSSSGPADRPGKGDKIVVRVASCHLDPGPFPGLVVRREQPDAWPERNLHKGLVLEHRTATRVSVQLPDGSTRTLDVPAGTLLPGMTVLVHISTLDGQMAYRYVGPCESRPQTPGWASPGRPLRVRVTSSASSAGARVRAVIPSTGQTLTLQPPATDCARAGQVYAAVPAAHVDASGGVHVVAMAVSSRLE